MMRFERIRPAACMLVFAVALVLVMGGGASPARADPPTAPYLDSANNDTLWDLVAGTGTSWPDTFPAEWADGGVEEAAAAAGALPALSVVGTVVLGAAGFDVGWKIGRTIDTKWLHLTDPDCIIFGCPSAPSGSPVLTTDAVTLGQSGLSIWTGASTSSRYVEYTVGATSGTGFTCDSNHYPGSYFPYGSYSGQSSCLREVYNVDMPHYVSAALAAGFTEYSSTDCSPLDFQARGSGCFVLLKPISSADALVSSPPVPYTSQTVNLTTNISAPSETSGNLSAMRAAVTAGGTALQNEINAALDPTDYERPGPNGSPAGGLKMAWPAPESTETYDQYVSRLQGLGWLGIATKVTLEENNGDPEYVDSGVPCTSVTPGTTIGANDPATIYQNPVTLGSGDPDPASPACLGSLTTSLTSNKCEFTGDTRWADLRSGNEAFYDGACNDAWSYFWANQTVFDTSGNVLDSSSFVNMTSIAKIKDGRVTDYLAAVDPDMSHWRKARTTSFAFTYPFQIHFYWNASTNTVLFGLDFKLKFNNVFTP